MNGRLGGLLALVLALGVVTQAAADPLAEARALLDAGKAGAAFRLLAPLEEERAGDPAYDYLLGVSALNTERPGVAVFALERVVALEPENAAARAELARAYFVLRDNELARQEFENVQRLDPAEPVQAAISRYLDALDQRFEAQRTTATVWAEGGLGYDSNVVAAADDREFVFPIGFQFENLNRDLDAAYALGELGAAVAHSITPDLYLFLNGRVHLKQNVGEQFDEHGYAADGGLRYFSGANTFTVTLTGDQLFLDGTRYRSIGALSGQWQRTLDAANQVTAYGRLANLRYPESAEYPGNPFSDADQWMLGIAWGHSFLTRGSPVVYVSGYYAREDERREANVLGRNATTTGLVERDFWGVRVGGQYTLRPEWDLVGSLTYQPSDYDGVHPSYTDRERDDYYWHLSLGADYRLGRQIVIKPRLMHTRNDSNVPVSDYDRTQVQVTARYVFQ